MASFTAAIGDFISSILNLIGGIFNTIFGAISFVINSVIGLVKDLFGAAEGVIGSLIGNIFIILVLGVAFIAYRTYSTQGKVSAKGKKTM